MRKFTLVFIFLLTLCVGHVWAYTGSNPLSGGSFYIYHPVSGTFLSSQATAGDNKMKSVLTPELWAVANPVDNGDYKTVNLYHTISGTDYYFNMYSSWGSWKTKISTSSETTELQISTTNTDLSAYRICRKKDGPKYLNYDGSSFSVAGSTGVQNDWVFITPANYSAFIEEIRLEYLPTASGWSKITSMPANPEQYYYCLVDNTSKVMLSLQTGSNNGSGNKAAFYKSFTNPLTDGSFLWEFEDATTNSGYYTIKNVSYVGKYMYSPDGEKYKFYTNNDQVTETTHHTFLIEYAGGSWTITNSDYLAGEGSDAKHIGLWTPSNGYENGQELAANKQTADAGHFQIYAIRKDAAFWNTDFEGNPWSFGWEGTGSNKAQEFVNQSGNANFSGTFAEMWKNNKLEADGDIYQSVSLATGYYKLKAKVVSTNIYSTIYANVGGTEYNDWFTGDDTSSDRAIIFYVPSASSVRLGYKTRNHDSSASTSTWTAVDNFSLTSASKLNVSITGDDFEAGAISINVEDEISSAFTFAYSDNDIAVPAPTAGSGSSDFYYTIATNTISSIKTGCNAGHTSDVITYDPSTNTITAWNAGTATITFHHNGTATVNEAEESFEVTVSKIANPITVTLNEVEKNAMNVAYNATIALAYSSPSNVAYSVTRRAGSDEVTTLDGGTLTASSSKEGVDYWDIVQTENYKYEAGSSYVRIKVNAVAETESFLYTALTSSEYNVNNGNYEISLDYSPLEIRYRAKRNWGNVANTYCSWYDANGTQIDEKKDDLTSDFKNFSKELPENARKIVISKSGTGDKIIDQIYVVRRTYINSSVDDTDLGTVYVGNTETTTLNLDWGTSNGGNLTVSSDNSRFAVSAATVVTSANSNGSTTLTITYTPDNANIGDDKAIISVHDNYNYSQVTVSATAALKEKSLVYGFGMMYNATRNILLDDAGTDVYEATYNSGTETVTLNKLEPSAGNPIIPFGNVVLLYKANDKSTESSSINYEYTETATNLSLSGSNCFVHHNGTTPSGCVDYVLKNVGGEVAFHLYTGDAAALNGYNVLRLSTGSGSAPAMIRIVMDENNTTALVPVYEDGQMTKPVENGQIYTILGVPVRDMSRPGIYIQNGKKYIVH